MFINDGAAPRHTWGPRRVTGLLAGLVLIAGSLGFASTGAFAAWSRSSGTYVDLGAHGSYQSAQYGLATDSTDWRTTLFGWAGTARLQVTSDDQKPLFVGVAAPADLNPYLSGAAYTTISSRDSRSTDHAGTAPTVKSVRWTAHAEGTGTQTLRWKATDGPQVVFAMNADGSRPVHVRIVSSAVTLNRMPWWVAATPLTLGIILLLAGALFLRRTIHLRRA